ncbi:sterol desaturase family protein [Streptomyces sp. NPDC006971]|uniref:sterol desaturase family protein n=1 Tax=Streptomyces sp. NPDC006971 TaxID=3154784 RepID=UPI0033EB5B08
MENCEPAPGGGPEPGAGPAEGKGSPASRARGLLRVSAYPVLLLAAISVATAALRFDWEPGSVSPLFLLGTIAYLTILERLIPHQRSWHPSPSEWRWYGIYFLLTTAASGMAQYMVTATVSVLTPEEPVLALWEEIPAALLTGSLASYLVHRIGHTNPILWRFHGVHHVPDKVNVANNGVNHVMDIVLAQGFVQLALALIGFSRESVLVVGIFAAAQGYFVHANIDVRIGRLNHVLASPEQHRLHHSTDLSEAGHYGSDLSIWDHLFNSYTWRPGREPVAIGLVDPASFPPTGEITSTLLHPWRRAKRAGPGPA